MHRCTSTGNTPQNKVSLVAGFKEERKRAKEKRYKKAFKLSLCLCTFVVVVWLAGCVLRQNERKREKGRAISAVDALLIAIVLLFIRCRINEHTHKLWRQSV